MLTEDASPNGAAIRIGNHLRATVLAAVLLALCATGANAASGAALTVRHHHAHHRLPHRPHRRGSSAVTRSHGRNHRQWRGALGRHLSIFKPFAVAHAAGFNHSAAPHGGGKSVPPVTSPSPVPSPPPAPTGTGSSPTRATAMDFGLSVNPAELTDAQLGQALDMAKQAGATSISSGAVWWYLNSGQSSPRSYNWSALDRLVAAATARGLKVTLQLTGTPDWVHPELASTVTNFYDRIWYPPRGASELQAWANYVSDVVARYGERVSSYELWNEPNLPDFWKPAPQPSEFAALLRSGYLAAKAADPNATVVSGGLSRNDIGYLQTLYISLHAYADAQANHDFFDVLGIHPYSDDRGPSVDSSAYVHPGPFGQIDDNFLGFTRMKAVMDANGDTGKSIRLGEYGFSTTTTWMTAVPDTTRATYATQALALARAYPYVRELNWYGFLAAEDGAPWAMLSTTMQPSATFTALTQAAAGA